MKRKEKEKTLEIAADQDNKSQRKMEGIWHNVTINTTSVEGKKLRIEIHPTCCATNFPVTICVDDSNKWHIMNKDGCRIEDEKGRPVSIFVKQVDEIVPIDWDPAPSKKRKTKGYMGRIKMNGKWSARFVRTTNERGETFEIETKVGIRGIDCPVTVLIENGKWSINEYSGQTERKIEIKNVNQLIRVFPTNQEE
jgi:hypothetical protein